MKNDLAKKVFESVKLRDVMEFYGIHFDTKGFAKCPFHNEKTASLSIKKEHYKCFGCGAYGGVIDFVMKYHGLQFRQALVKLNADFNLGLISNRRPTYRERMQMLENKRINDAKKQFEEDIHTQYLTLCVVHSILYGRFVRGELWLKEIVEEIDCLLDDFTGEEARGWEMIIPRKFIQKNIS